MQILGVAGRARAGKTEFCLHAAKTIVNKSYGLPRLLNFAGPLKEAAKILGVEREERPELYRNILQVIGTDIIRAEEPNWWCKMMDVHLCRAQQDEKNGIGKRGEIFVLIDDIRFMNEVECLKKWNAKLLFICADARLRDLHAQWRKHESEELSHNYSNGKYSDELFDFVLTNIKDLEHYHLEIEKNIDMLFGGYPSDGEVE